MMFAAKLFQYRIFPLEKVIGKKCSVLFQYDANCHKVLTIPMNFIHSINDNKTSMETLNDSLKLPDNFFDNHNIPEVPGIDTVLTEPSFASIGLNNYTPTGLVQFILENVHISLDWPWWACIVFTSVFLKTCLIPIQVNQKRNIINMQNMMADMTKISMEAMEARQSGNSLLMLQKLKELEKQSIERKFSFSSHLKPILIQGSLFFTVFLALRGMTKAPVASLSTGGLWWFTDLSVCDPYYILPLIAAGSITLLLEINIGSVSHVSSKSKWLSRAVGPVVFACIAQFPATLLLYWSCSNVYTLIISQMMKMPAVVKALDIPTVTEYPKTDNPNNFGLSESMELLRSLHEIIARENAQNTRWSKEEQAEVLNRGMAAAAARKKIKDLAHKPVVDIKGEIVENEKKNKM